MKSIQYIKNKLTGLYGAWFVTLILFILTMIPDYDQMVTNKMIACTCVLGLYYCKHNGVFNKSNIGCLIGTSIIALLIGILLKVNHVFDYYSYYYYTITCGLIVYGNLYVVKIKKIIVERPKIKLNLLQIITVLVFFLVGISVNVQKWTMFSILIIYLPLMVEEYNKNEKQQIMRGIIDGICVGTILAQGYAFLFVHYFDNPRITGFVGSISVSSFMYACSYAAFICKYMIYKMEKQSIWKIRISWFLAVFCLALLYLTGGRGSVISIVITTFLIYFFYQWIKTGSIKNCKWILQTAIIGMVSLLLFPLAYASVRYLPTIINRPDYVDSLGHRYYSLSYRLLDEPYLYDGNFVNDGHNGKIEYITFASSFYYNMIRLIPGSTSILTDFYETNEIVYKYTKTTAREVLAEVLESYDYTTVNNGSEAVGMSPDNPWLEDATDTSSATKVRNAIHSFYFEQLKWFGDETGSVYLYLTATSMIGNAHSMVLDFGFRYGIFAMIALCALFTVLIVSNIKLIMKHKNYDAIFPVVFASTIFVCGLFENTLGTSYYSTFVLFFLASFSLKDSITIKET